MKEREYERRMIKLIFHTAQDEVIDSEGFWVEDTPSEEETSALMANFEDCDYVEAYTFWAEDTPNMIEKDESMRHVWNQKRN